MIFLPDELVDRCVEYGTALAKHYAAGGSPQSRAFSSHGAESDPELLADSKVAECVFAFEMGLDPLTAVKWIVDAPDGGVDVMVGRTRVDVKQTALANRFLIWPVRKTSIFDSKQFDVLVLVKTEADYLEHIARGICRGWISKREFRQQREIAGPDHKLAEGTRFVSEDRLHRMAVFPGRLDDAVGVPFEHYCWCGESGSFGYYSPQPQPGWFCGKHRPCP